MKNNMGTSITVARRRGHRGRIVPREPSKLPEKRTGLLTIAVPAGAPGGEPKTRRPVELPLRSDGRHIINPTPDDLDAIISREHLLRHSDPRISSGKERSIRRAARQATALLIPCQYIKNVIQDIS